MTFAVAPSRVSTLCLDWLIDPVSSAAFFDDYWGKAPLVVRRDRPDYFQSVLTLGDVDAAIAHLNLTFPDLSLVNASREIKKGDYVGIGNIINPDSVYREFAGGSTVILAQLQSKLRSLAEICRALEDEFSAPFQTNIYLTPSGSQGFKPHYDTHDVLVLQAAGSKRWRLYGMPMTLPLSGWEFDSKMHDTGPISMEFDLQAGDVLYMPRGLVHDAESTSETSLHITVGILSYTWADFLQEALASVIVDHPEFRRSLPVGFAHPDFDRSDAERTFAELTTQFSRSAEFSVTRDYFTDEFVRTRSGWLPRLEQIQRLNTLASDSTVVLVPHLIHKIAENGQHIQLRCQGKAMTFPKHAKEALLFALSTPMFRVEEVPTLGHEGRLVFIRRLVREGILRQP
jgi:ribosomal protein L16 Arg81 hydroxylase